MEGSWFFLSSGEEGFEGGDWKKRANEASGEFLDQVEGSGQ